ncbi:MAG: hypothetical protein U0K81_08435 [Paludibacteraceae bacterium]|nr:hypothetical protein [Paludibacteraceae bacterium]
MGDYVKTTGGYDVKVPSSGQTVLNTVLGALGTAGFAGINLRNLVGGLFNQGTFNGMGVDAIVSMLIPMLTQMGYQRAEPACSEDHCVNRYELDLKQQLAAKDSEISLLKANTFTDGKMLEMYKYFDGELRGVREFICEQKVRNQGNADAIRELDKKIDTSVALEAERRKCADRSIVDYVNGTFAVKRTANYETGTTTTTMETYNPLAKCEC